MNQNVRNNYFVITKSLTAPTAYFWAFHAMRVSSYSVCTYTLLFNLVTHTFTMHSARPRCIPTETIHLTWIADKLPIVHSWKNSVFFCLTLLQSTSASLSFTPSDTYILFGLATHLVNLPPNIPQSPPWHAWNNEPLPVWLRPLTVIFLASPSMQTIYRPNRWARSLSRQLIYYLALWVKTIKILLFHLQRHPWHINVIIISISHTWVVTNL